MTAQAPGQDLPPAGRGKDEVARELIAWHFLIDPEITTIYRVRVAQAEQEERQDEPIKLLEVSLDADETGSVDAFWFEPAGDITYPSVVALVTPRELEMIKLDLLALPEGWSLSNAEAHSPPQDITPPGAESSQ